MAELSDIEWTDATWNPITGCTMVSAGCTNCYAMSLAGTRLKHHPSREGLTRVSGGRHVWTGEVRLNEKWLDQPLRWIRPRMIFVCAHGDLFHESVPDEWIDRVFAVMAQADQHTFQVLTKRPERMREYLTGNPWQRIAAAILEPLRVPGKVDVIFDPHQAQSPLPLPNVWLGTSVEDQAAWDARWHHLAATPAAVRFISAEPLLGPIDMRGPGQLHWLICGGESGPGARVWPGFEDAARSLRDQCDMCGVAFFMKQMAGVRKADMPPIPADLMIRDMPKGGCDA